MTSYLLEPHYRCVFDVPAKGSPDALWKTLVEAVREWIAFRQRWNLDMRGAWFVAGGVRVRQGAPRVKVATARLEDGNPVDVPHYWAVQYEHPCANVASRQWRTDIGITALEVGGCRISVATYYWLLPGFVGEDPPKPTLSVPSVVSRVIQGIEWPSTSLEGPASGVPLVLHPGDAPDLLGWLSDPARKHPLVYVTPERASGKPLVDAERLAHQLIGLGEVVVAANPEVDEENNWIFPETYRCFGGMVRVYQTRLDATRPGDFRRHRFFLAQTIEQMGSEAVEDIIVRCAVRWAGFEFVGVLTSVDDVAEHVRHQRLKELSDRLAGAAAAGEAQAIGELLHLYEEENAQQRRRIEALESHNVEKDNAIEYQCAITEELEDKLRSAEIRRDQAWAAHGALHEQLESLSVQQATLRDLASLPRTLPELLALISKLQSDRIVFTERAIKSAEHAGYKLTGDGLREAWHCLWCMATTLHDLCFSAAGPVALSARFKELTGLDLAVTETSETKRNARLEAMRAAEVSGREVVARAHVKVGGRPPQCLRVYYHADHAQNLIVITHCGDHLETDGTRRRREG